MSHDFDTDTGVTWAKHFPVDHLTSYELLALVMEILEQFTEAFLLYCGIPRESFVSEGGVRTFVMDLDGGGFSGSPLRSLYWFRCDPDRFSDGTGHSGFYRYWGLTPDADLRDYAMKIDIEPSLSILQASLAPLSYWEQCLEVKFHESQP